MASPSLNTCTIHSSRMFFNRIHIFFHLAAVLSLLYYRTTALFRPDNPSPPAAWILISIAEFLFASVWFFTQSFRWRLVSRTASPEYLPEDYDLPGVDVFISTVDPKKEPTMDVMNSVLSALALDYPRDKLAVYLCDDGGSPVTLYALKLAGGFAKLWIPFCDKYGIVSRSPGSFFSAFSDDERVLRGDEFAAEEREIKAKYEEMKEDVDRFGNDQNNNQMVCDRSARVEMILDGGNNNRGDDDRTPILVYISRERRPSLPHRYKAGNVNSFVRVSALITNNPILLVLDCDMFCNDPTSAKQAMCFHLDPKFSTSLAYVQFPQVFYNVSNNDIYDAQTRSAFKTKWQGMDGLRGPVMSGTGYYLKRKALFGTPDKEDLFNGEDNQEVYGRSQKFIDSLKKKNEYPTDEILEEAKILASCTYEENTQWGKEIGYNYDCLLESTFTGYVLQCKGWRSVYLYPKRPCFLGCAPVDMKEAMVQIQKWCSELFRTTFSKYSPFTYGLFRLPILHFGCYAYFVTMPLNSIAFILYGVVPQWCFLRGIPLFPKVWDSWFSVFAVVYLSSLFQHLVEVSSSNGNLGTFWNEQVIHVVRSVSASLFALIDVFLKMLNMKKKKANLTLSDKAIDKDKLETYKKGKFDLQGAQVFMVPLLLLSVWNTVCFVGGFWRLLTVKNFEEMFGQILVLSLALMMSYPILQGVIAKRKK